jgi:hypothetical protein
MPSRMLVCLPSIDEGLAVFLVELRCGNVSISDLRIRNKMPLVG